MKNLILTFCLSLFFSVSFAIAPITGPTTGCVGSAITLADATPLGSWTSSSTSIATVDASGSVTGVSSGAVTITYTVGTTYVTAPITIYPVPAPITGTNGFCQDAMTDPLSDATSGGWWSVAPSTIVYITSTGVLNHTGSCPGACGTATVYYTLPTGCATSWVVAVSPIEVVGVPAHICLGSSGGCSAGPLGGTWSSSFPSVASVDPSSGVITTIAAGSSLITYTLSGCHMSLPSIIGTTFLSHHTYNNADTVCTGPDFYVSSCASAGSVITYFGDGTSNSTTFGSVGSADIYHSYTMPGTYQVKQKLYDGGIVRDSAVFSYEYLYCSTLAIKIYNDNNNNCLFDAGDRFSNLPVAIRVDSNGIAVDTVTCTSGIYYKAYGPPGSIYSFRIISGPGGLSVACPSSGVISDTIQFAVNTYTTKYFGLQCGGATGFDLSENATIICGRHAVNCNIFIDNAYCVPEAATLTMTASPKHNFMSATPTPTSVEGNIITWNLGPVVANSPLPVHVNARFEVAGAWLIPGDTIQSSFSVGPVTGDADPSNNNSERTDTAKMSYDPNEMSVIPQGIIPSGQQLMYSINFENTGNDTAFNISVYDTLSDNVDIKTFKVLRASAVMNIAILKDPIHNIVKFDFPGINLLDSSHHGQCDGAVFFTVNAKNGLPDGTTIDNHAGIFFDDNPVVMTDTVENIIGTITTTTTVKPTGNASKIAVYPNPVTNQLTISSGNEISSVSISNLLGQTIFSNEYNANTVQVNVADLPSGVYFVKVNGSEVRKFVKE